MRWFIVAMLLPVAISQADPPMPNLDDPVDYVAWVNQEFDVGDQPNAADEYLAAVEQFKDDDQAYELANKVRGRVLNSVERRKLGVWIEANKKCLELVEAAAAQRACFFKLQGDSFVEVMLPYLQPMRRIGMLLAARARVRLAADDLDGALADLVMALNAGAHLREQPMLISHLVGCAISDAAYRVLLDLPLHTQASIDCEAVIKKLRRSDREIESATKSLLGEQLFCRDFLQRHCRDSDRDGKIDKFLKFNEDGTLGDYVDLDPPRALEDLVLEADEHWGRCQAISAAKDYQAAKALAAERTTGADYSGPLAVTLASLDQADAIRRCVEAIRHGARMVLRIHAYKAAEGNWPADLKTAARRDGPTFRGDPFSGAELIYRVEAGEPLIYSVGYDGDDDKGERAEKLRDDGDFVYWPPKPE